MQRLSIQLEQYSEDNDVTLYHDVEAYNVRDAILKAVQLWELTNDQVSVTFRVGQRTFHFNVS